MDLHAVRAGRYGLRRGVPELPDHTGQFLGGELPRNRGHLHAGRGEHLLLGADRGRGHRLPVVRGVVRVGHPPDVHQLDEQRSVADMHRVGDLPPALDVLGGVHAGGVQVALAVLRGLRALGDDQTQARALPVVLGHQLGRGSVRQRSATGHRGHRQSVRKFDPAQGERLPEGGGRGHDGSSFAWFGVRRSTPGAFSTAACQNGSEPDRL